MNEKEPEDIGSSVKFAVIKEELKLVHKSCFEGKICRIDTVFTESV